jgi:hypothetical protein
MRAGAGYDALCKEIPTIRIALVEWDENEKRTGKSKGI